MITREYVVALINGDYAILEDENKEQISIARALLKDSPVILLDEATASLDAENETQIQEAISKLIKNKTVLITTSFHRKNVCKKSLVISLFEIVSTLWLTS